MKKAACENRHPMPTHYHCTGTCKGVSPVPKSCGAPTCTRHGTPLVACHCADGKHEPEKSPNI